MKKLKTGQRVRVLREYFRELEINAEGNVVRECIGDNSAWIRLDRRVDDALAHPFPATDATRSTDVRAFPEDCETV